MIDVAAGEKIPRKGGPGITNSDLLVINKTDLAPFVGRRSRRDGSRFQAHAPRQALCLRQYKPEGVDVVAQFIEAAGGLGQS